MDRNTEQAIDWLITLDSGRVSETERQAFEVWLHQSPVHAQAWALLQQRLSRSMGTASTQLRRDGSGNTALGIQALLAPIPTTARRRKELGGGLAALVASATAGWMVHRQTPLTTLAADLRTGTAQRMNHRLPDGSEILLDARSAVDIAFNDALRLVHLREGALMAHVLAEADSVRLRPFVVQSAQGQVQALGTRFMVRQAQGRTLVHVTEHSVRLSIPKGQQHTLHEGQSAWMDADQITPIETERMDPAAWVDGIISVHDQSLGEVIEALRPYQAGIIRISPQAAQVRIFGVFSLAQPQQMLQDLVNTHPVQIRQWGSWLTVIEMSKSGS